MSPRQEGSASPRSPASDATAMSVIRSYPAVCRPTGKVHRTVNLRATGSLFPAETPKCLFQRDLRPVRGYRRGAPMASTIELPLRFRSSTVQDSADRPAGGPQTSPPG
jgi:hypothetical protein